jgi:hypothetical protein
MVSSLEWEAFREGYDDLRYLTTLETAIACAAAAEPEHPEVRKARQLRESWWAADPRVPAQVEALSAQDYQIRRAAMATAIETLKELGTAE